MCVANPILPATGEKIQTEIDYRGERLQALDFIRTYRSNRAIEPYAGVATAGLGDTWSHNYNVTSVQVGTPSTAGSTATVIFGDGNFRTFVWDSGMSGWKPLNSADSLTYGSPGLIYKKTQDNSTWQFDADGKLLSAIQRNGWITSYNYSTTSTTSSLAPVAGLLTSVSNQFTRTLSLAYNANVQLASVSTPDAQTISFSYDAVTSTTSLGRLSTVTYPGSLGGTVKRTYVYESATFPQLLTGIIDENGNRLSTYVYDAQGRAVSSQHAGGADLYSVSYGTSTSIATVTDPLGTVRAYSYGANLGKLAVTGASAPGDALIGVANSRMQDVNGFVTQETDFLGFSTTYTWDAARRLLLSTTRAVAASQTQTISTQWHNTMTLPVLVTKTGRTTAYSYDLLGNKLTESVVDTVTGLTRTWSWSYNPQGLAAAATAPNGATTYFTYDPAGNLGTATNALGYTTQYSYDTGGRVTQKLDPTGLVTAYVYDLRGRLLSQNVGGLTSTFAYTPIGLVGTATMPDGRVVAYSYDNAQRLTGWSDNRNAQGVYALDAMGNRTIEQIKDGAGNLVWQLARAIDSVNRIGTQTVGTSGAAEPQTYGYNANADLTRQTNGLSQATNYGLDGLRRISSITDAASATALLSYNALDAVVLASDFKGVTTTYARDALGNALQESTPDAGTSTTSYNSLGLPATVIDAIGQASTLTYDILGRPTQIRFADGKTTTLAYDLTGSTYNAPGAPDASKGYLSRVDDRSGSTSYQRDIFGRVVLKTQTLTNSTSQQVTYSFTATGQAGTTTYPSGKPLSPAYNSAGQLTSLSWNGTPLITNLQWTPLGQPGTWTWAFSGMGGTDIQGKRSYDTAGRVTATELNTYGYDAAGRITAITQQLYAPTDPNPSNSGIAQTTASWTASYDATGRLTGFIESTALTTTTGPGTASFSYDSNGNRLSSLQTATAGTSTSSTARSYAVTSGTNQLLGYGQSTVTNLGSSTSTVSYTYNAAGDITNQGSKTFGFNAESRLISMAEGSTVTWYTQNALGQRVFKTEPTSGTATTATNGFAFVYDEDGNLLGEYGTGGPGSTGSTEYIWLPTPNGPMPIAAVVNGSLFAIHTDNLNTPRRLSNTSTVAVWQWKYSAFGDEQPTIANTRFANTAVNPNPGTTTVASVTFNLRYPGQYADAESGLSYNYFRSYDSNHGRYTQADPIGLEGGWNRFGYVGESPLSFSDPIGLMGNGSSGPKSSPINKGTGGPPLDYFQLGYTGPAFGASVTVDRFGNFYLGVQTGNVTPLPSGQACFGKVLGKTPLNEDELRDFIAGAGGQASFGQFGIGGGVAFSGGRTAGQVTVGTPQLPGQGAAGYNWRIGGEK